MPTGLPTRVLRTLVVDDSPVNRRLMELLLFDLGHAVVFASNGKEALKAVRREHFDYAFIDLQMPGMDGYQTAFAISKALGGQAPVMVACSATVGSDQQCADAGFDFVMSKPITPESLSAVLRGDPPASVVLQERPLCWVMPEGLAPLAQVAGKDRISGLLRLFVTESERRIDGLLKALKDRNMEAFALAAHTIYGSATQMGAQKLAAISKELETDAVTGARISIKKLTALASEFELVNEAISKFLAE